MRRPVVMTIAVAEPLTTLVPMKPRLARSRGLPSTGPPVDRADFSATWPRVSYFSSGMASPVKAAWLTKRSFELSNRTSAGIMSPAERWMRSPGTSSEKRTSRFRLAPSGLPSELSARGRRVTVAVVPTMARSACAAREDRNS